MQNKWLIVVVFTALAFMLLWWVTQDKNLALIPTKPLTQISKPETETKVVESISIRPKSSAVPTETLNTATPKATNQSDLLMADIQAWIKRGSEADEYEHHQEGLAMFAVAHESGDLIAMEVLLLNLHSWKTNINRPEQAVLGGDKIQLRRLSPFAMRLLSCDKKPDRCEQGGTYMSSQCEKIPSACGKSFQQWLDVILTPGMKMDLEDLKRFYSENVSYIN